MPPSLFPHALNTKSESATEEDNKKELSKGVVLDKDGKPCRTCTSSAAWMAMMKSSTSPSKGSKATASDPLASLPPAMADDCPPDVEALGHATWTFLHSLAATYPPSPTPAQQSKTKTFLSIFADIYPCWVCAEDFKDWMSEPRNDVSEALRGQEQFGQWLCRAHNAVNVKLGKPEFDCGLWRQRWKDGWRDGRCE